ncbi:hypothetical protein D3C72_918170 [compost metagenome]
MPEPARFNFRLRVADADVTADRHVGHVGVEVSLDEDALVRLFHLALSMLRDQRIVIDAEEVVDLRNVGHDEVHARPGRDADLAVDADDLAQGVHAGDPVGARSGRGGARHAPGAEAVGAIFAAALDRDRRGPVILQRAGEDVVVEVAAAGAAGALDEREVLARGDVEAVVDHRQTIIVAEVDGVAVHARLFEGIGDVDRRAGFRLVGADLQVAAQAVGEVVTDIQRSLGEGALVASEAVFRTHEHVVEHAIGQGVLVSVDRIVAHDDVVDGSAAEGPGLDVGTFQLRVQARPEQVQHDLGAVTGAPLQGAGEA